MRRKWNLTLPNTPTMHGPGPHLNQHPRHSSTVLCVEMNVSMLGQTHFSLQWTGGLAAAELAALTPVLAP
jgi:hypothetical protein